MTANVDFAYLKKSLGEKAKSFGPVTQRSFLKEMGIDDRMKVRNNYSYFATEKNCPCSQPVVKKPVALVLLSNWNIEVDFWEENQRKMNPPSNSAHM